ncbi:MAG: molybdopterin oxidoreductase family protein, partial [Alphaproteobacteria bacterium]|nr:molybdopterin oxidoreductase family protein [Alphaproteobacteria bacterium]
APNPDQLTRYIEHGGFWHMTLPPEQRFYKMANRAYLEFATQMGFLSCPEPIVFQLYSEPLQKFRLAARGHGAVLPPPSMRARLEESFDPLPIWYAPFEEMAADGENFPLHALTQRPMHMYHSWGSQNALLRQITHENRLFVHRKTAGRLGLKDDDWVWIESISGRVKGQIRLVDGVNPDTVWTWNAIAKRRGTWGLKDEAPEARKGFLLNHAIGDLLPADAHGTRHSNSDPVTGQAAWFDLRVRLRKCAAEEGAFSEPVFHPITPPAGLGSPPERLTFGAQFKVRSRV